MDDVPSSPEPEEQQNEDITFLTSFDVHFGQFVSCSEAFMLWSNENLSLHFRHIYSYIGIPDSFKVSIVIDYFISQYAVKSINTCPVSMGGNCQKSSHRPSLPPRSVGFAGEKKRGSIPP